MLGVALVWVNYNIMLLYLVLNLVFLLLFRSHHGCYCLYLCHMSVCNLFKRVKNFKPGQAGALDITVAYFFPVSIYDCIINMHITFVKL